MPGLSNNSNTQYRVGVVEQKVKSPFRLLMSHSKSNWDQVLPLFFIQLPVNAPGRQQVMVQVPRFLLLTWETQTAFLVPEFGLVYSSLLQAFRE